MPSFLNLMRKLYSFLRFRFLPSKSLGIMMLMVSLLLSLTKAICPWGVMRRATRVPLTVFSFPARLWKLSISEAIFNSGASKPAGFFVMNQ